MERVAVKELFGVNYLGPRELQPLVHALGFPEADFPDSGIPFPDEGLRRAAQSDHILVLCPSSIGGKPVTLRLLRDHFGIDPEQNEPCFYNQDWYLSEHFMDLPLDGKWHLLKKSVRDDSRAVQPETLLGRGIEFPPAIVCAWTFFAWYFARKEVLWRHDFLWCSDIDHNGDRVYVGKYHDIDGVNKNGFSIHRHLSLRNCYGSISFF